MATTAVGSDLPTLLDVVSRQRKDGAILEIAEVLTKQSAVFQDAVFVECNDGTSHEFSERTALPRVYKRRYNEGVPASKSRTGKLRETCAMWNGLSEVDKALANRNGNSMAFRNTEDVAFLMALRHGAEEAFLYDDTRTDQRNMMGIIPRYNSTTGPAASQVFTYDGAASGSDQTSILLVGWGPQTVYGIYPQGSSAGITFEDKGESWGYDANNNKYPVLSSWFGMQFGLCVENYRYISRLGNIDTSTISSSGDLFDKLIDQWYAIPREGLPHRRAWYCNTLVAKYLHKQARAQVDQSTLSIEKIAGEEILMILGAPVRITDSITNTEPVIV